MNEAQRSEESDFDRVVMCSLTGKKAFVTWASGHQSVVIITAVTDSHIETRDHINGRLYSRPSLKHKRMFKKIEPITEH